MLDMGPFVKLGINDQIKIQKILSLDIVGSEKPEPKAKPGSATKAYIKPI